MRTLLEKKTLSSFSLIVLIIIISTFAFYPSFSLSLYGDSWLNMSWSVYGLLDFLHPVHISSVQHFFTQYGSFDTFMGIMKNIFEFNPKPYFIVAFLFHTLAVFSLYPIAFYLSKNKKLAFLAVLFFSISSIGIGAIDWVFNAPVYLSVAFFNLFLFFIVFSKQKGREIYLLPACVFFFMAYIFAPVRMTGLLPFVIFLELCLAIIDRTNNHLKTLVIRIALLVFVVILIKIVGNSSGNISLWTDRFITGIRFGLQSITQGHYEFLLYPIVIFGGMVFPAFILTDYTLIISTNQIFSLLAISFLVYTTLIILLTYIIKQISSYRKLLFFIGFVFMTIIFITHILHKDTFSNLTNILSLVIGGLSLIFFITVGFAYRKSKKILLAITIALGWSFFTFLPPWWWIMNMPFQTYHRYLPPAATGIAILLMAFIQLGKSKITKTFLVIFVCLLVFVPHIVADREFFSENIKQHGNAVSRKIWSYMPHIPGFGKDTKKRVFYFEGDDGVILNDVVIFGFPARMTLLYNLRLDQPAPSASIQWSDIISSVTDGVYIQTPGKPVPIDSVYGFKLEKEKLTDITPQVRKKLMQELKLRKKV